MPQAAPPDPLTASDEQERLRFTGGVFDSCLRQPAGQASGLPAGYAKPEFQPTVDAARLEGRESSPSTRLFDWVVIFGSEFADKGPVRVRYVLRR